MDPYGCEKEMRDIEKHVDKFYIRIINKHKRTKREREDKISKGDMGKRTHGRR